MAIHIIEPNAKNLHGRFSREIEPVQAISSGDIVRYRTLDSGWCNFEQTYPFEKPTKLEERTRELDNGHALCRPVYIQGAQAGMTIEVRLNKIRTGFFKHEFLKELNAKG